MQLPQILPYIGAGRVKLAVWNASGDVEQINAAAFDQLLERLGNVGITPTEYRRRHQRKRLG